LPKVLLDIEGAEAYFFSQGRPSEVGIMMSGIPTYAIRKPVAAVLALGALAILGLNVALVLQNRALKQEMSAPPALLPQVGTRISSLEGVGLDGSRLVISFGGQSDETLLFVFSTRCGVCGLNWPQWQSIARSIKDKPYRLVYANTAPLLDAEYARQDQIEGATVFTQLDPRLQLELNLRITPLTVLFGSDGRLEKVWPGLLEGGPLSDLRRSLRLMSS
jgi:hypothetical protein